MSSGSSEARECASNVGGCAVTREVRRNNKDLFMSKKEGNHTLTISAFYLGHFYLQCSEKDKYRSCYLYNDVERDISSKNI